MTKIITGTAEIGRATPGTLSASVRRALLASTALAAVFVASTLSSSAQAQLLPPSSTLSGTA